jgi:hypothetical protein
MASNPILVVGNFRDLGHVPRLALQFWPPFLKRLEEKLCTM